MMSAPHDRTLCVKWTLVAVKGHAAVSRSYNAGELILPAQESGSYFNNSGSALHMWLQLGV